MEGIEIRIVADTWLYPSLLWTSNKLLEVLYHCYSKLLV